jgi:hypothetical protein
MRGVVASRSRIGGADRAEQSTRWVALIRPAALESAAQGRSLSGAQRAQPGSQLHPLVVPHDSQTKHEPAGRIRTPQVEQ